MKHIIKQIKTDADQITIVPISDLHIGDPHSDWNHVKQLIQTVKDDPNALCICAGDLIDNATKTSVGDIYGQKLNPNEQINLVSELLQPIKDRIICYLDGNHEARTYRSDGICIGERVCRELGIPDVYAHETALLTLIINNRVYYRIYVTHGSGGGRKIGGKANRLLELADTVAADIYIAGHTHVPLVTRRTKMHVDMKDNKLAQKELLFVNLAGALSYGGYGEVQGFTPTSCVNPTLYLDTNKKFAWAEL